jgi:short-subunit dehydrogenase
MKKVIIIGATSGIGRALAELYLKAGWMTGLTGRRVALLEELKAVSPSSVVIEEMDVTATTEAGKAFARLVHELGRVDLVIIAAGTGHIDPELPWAKELETITTNVTGFTALALAAYKVFEHQGYGHLAAISSIAGIRGGSAPAYRASKAFVSNYLQSIRYMATRSGKPIYVTDICPGFVDTAMARGEGLFWVSSPQKAAGQIFRALEGRQKHLYVTGRWRLVAWLLKLLPEPLYQRLL